MKRKNNPSDLEIYFKASALGAVAGLRAFTVPALLGYFASNQENNSSASRKVSAILGLLAAGEIVGDKLPFTPNRTDAPGLIARIISGAAVGGLVCAHGKKSVPAGIAIGVASSVAAAYAGQHIRQAIAEKSGVPSAVLGAVEDAIAIGIGLSALKD
jgi:uncharacterized membrane protein